MSLVLAIATAAETLAHHPGSHAARQRDGRVRLDVSTVVPDTCMAVASVERGTPASVQAPRGAEHGHGAPRTAGRTDMRDSGHGRAAVVVLAIPPEAKTLHLFIGGPDGIRAMGRVPIR
jgi:hypothetical protein